MKEEVSSCSGERRRTSRNLSSDLARSRACAYPPSKKGILFAPWSSSNSRLSRATASRGLSGLRFELGRRRMLGFWFG